jgi:hypothetical protein
VVCGRRGGDFAGVLIFFWSFFMQQQKVRCKEGGETEIGRGRRLDGEREKVVAFFLFLLLLFRCNCMLSGKSDRLMKTEAFPGECLSLFRVIFLLRRRCGDFWC